MTDKILELEFSSILHNVEKSGGILALSSEDFWTGGRIAETVARNAAILNAKGIAPGDRVLILHGNTPAFFADLLATWSIGACAICLNPQLTQREVQNIEAFIKPTIALNVEGQTNSKELKVPVTVLANELEHHYSGVDNPIDLDGEALILFTSGTTDIPKGVVHSFRSLMARFALNAQFIEKDDMAVTMSPLPTHFGHGLIGNGLTPLLSGAKLILFPANDVFASAKLGGVIDNHQVTFMSSVPTFWRVVTNLGKPPVQQSLRRIHIGSAPLSATLWKKVIEWTGISEVINMYGITETANWLGGASASHFAPEDGLVGGLWGGEVRIKTETNEIRTTGSGEILIKTPSLMVGYEKQPDLTDKIIQEGWFHTGDIGTVDSQGVIRITGRLKLEINRAGTKIYPEEIEILLDSHPMIQETCVFGIPDSVAGELVGVAVSLVGTATIDVNDIRQWCLQRITREKVPEHWHVLQDLPKNDRGKVDRIAITSTCINKIRIGAS